MTIFPEFDPVEDPFTDENLRLPKEQEQLAVIWAFKKIAVKQRTPDGKVWWPGQIVDELWSLWEERPKEKGRRAQFVDKYLQRVGRLRRGVTSKSVKDPLLYYLLTRFVSKHSLPGEFVAHGQEIRFIQQSAECMGNFFDTAGDVEDKRFPSNKFEKKALSKRVWDLSKPFESIVRMDSTDSEIMIFCLTSKNQLPVVDTKAKFRKLSDKYIAIKKPETIENQDNEDSYYFATLFRSDEAQLELGFFLRSIETFFFRGVVTSPLNYDFFDAKNSSVTTDKNGKYTNSRTIQIWQGANFQELNIENFEAIERTREPGTLKNSSYELSVGAHEDVVKFSQTVLHTFVVSEQDG